MSTCPPLSLGGTARLASALDALDCRTGESTALAFSRLFGPGGHLLPALTILLTLYIGFFAFSLLTGRSRLGVSALTPRMVTLGLVLTFATSWAAYQSTIWTITTSAPDEVASLLAGSHGSATRNFADQLQTTFDQISDAAAEARKPAPPTETGITPATPMAGGFTAATVLSISGLMLLLGTLGLLVTAKIGLAALLALGPVFIVLALFPGTRGLFEGWLRAVTLFALVPLFTVLIGGAAVAALAPVVREIGAEGAEPSSGAVGGLFVGCSVYLALMVLVLKAAGLIVSHWQASPRASDLRGLPAQAHPRFLPTAAPAGVSTHSVALAPVNDRVHAIVAAATPMMIDAPQGNRMPVGAAARPVSGEVIPFVPAGQAPQGEGRVRGIGSRFRDRPAALRKGHAA